MSFELAETKVGSVIVLELVGRLQTPFACQVFDETIHALIRDAERALVLDCSRLELVDSQGIRMLVRAVTHFEKNGGKIKFIRLNASIRQVLKVMRLVDIFENFDSEEGAISSLELDKEISEPNLQSKKERRRWPRANSNMTVQVEKVFEGTSTLGRALNLSEGGVYVQTQEAFDPHTEVAVRLNLPPIPPGIPIEARGLVVRSQPGLGMGIQLLLLANHQRASIANFVRRSIS